MENYEFILKNKPLPTEAQPIVEKMTSDGEKILFVIVGDLGLGGRYSETALIFTDSAVVCVNGSARYSSATPIRWHRSAMRQHFSLTI